jgi:hypothetical protein
VAAIATVATLSADGVRLGLLAAIGTEAEVGTEAVVAAALVAETSAKDWAAFTITGTITGEAASFTAVVTGAAGPLLALAPGPLICVEGGGEFAANWVARDWAKPLDGADAEFASWAPSAPLPVLAVAALALSAPAPVRAIFPPPTPPAAADPFARLGEAAGGPPDEATVMDAAMVMLTRVDPAPLTIAGLRALARHTQATPAPTPWNTHNYLK